MVKELSLVEATYQPMHLPSLSLSYDQLPVRKGLNSTAASRTGAVVAAPKSSMQPTSASALPVVIDRPELLACSPDNSIWVYGSYVFQYLVADAATEMHTKRTINKMMREAARHFTVALFCFERMTPVERRAEVLRGVPASVQQHLSNETAGETAPAAASSAAWARSSGGATPILVNNSFDAATGTIQRLPRPPRDPRRGNISTFAGGTGRGPTMTSFQNDGPVPCDRDGDTAESREETIFRSLLRTWPTAMSVAVGSSGATTKQKMSRRGSTAADPLHLPRGLRVNIVFDFIASRKTLGGDPLHSRPGQLAEKLYQYIRSVYAPFVHSIVIGMSDAKTTFVGRDIVCPYQHFSLNSTLFTNMRRVLLMERQQRDVATAALISASNDNTAGSSGVLSASFAGEGSGGGDVVPLTSLSAHLTARLERHGPDAVLPQPYARVSPHLLNSIDQTRLILFIPSDVNGPDDGVAMSQWGRP